MDIEMNHAKKLVMVWLTHRDQQDEVVQAQLKTLYTDCKARRYTVATFLSGDRDLQEQTSGLLCYNQRRAAQRAVEGRS